MRVHANILATARRGQTAPLLITLVTLRPPVSTAPATHRLDFVCRCSGYRLSRLHSLKLGQQVSCSLPRTSVIERRPTRVSGGARQPPSGHPLHSLLRRRPHAAIEPAHTPCPLLPHCCPAAAPLHPPAQHRPTHCRVRTASTCSALCWPPDSSPPVPPSPARTPPAALPAHAAPLATPPAPSCS